MTIGYSLLVEATMLFGLKKSNKDLSYVKAMKGCILIK